MIIGIVLNLVGPKLMLGIWEISLGDKFAKIAPGCGNHLNIPVPLSYVKRHVSLILLRVSCDENACNTTSLHIKKFLWTIYKGSIDRMLNDKYLIYSIIRHGPFMDYLYGVALNYFHIVTCGWIGFPDHYVFESEFTAGFYLVRCSSNNYFTWFSPVPPSSCSKSYVREWCLVAACISDHCI